MGLTRAPVELTLHGIEEARSRLTNLAVTVSGYSRTVHVGSSLPYAYGQETGRHRISGKLARRSGPTYFLTFAAQEVLDQATPDLLRGLEMSAQGRRLTGLGQVLRVARWVRRLAKKYAPRGEGNKAFPAGSLRRSLRVTVSRADALRRR
jgi:hypothetical protein